MGGASCRRPPSRGRGFLWCCVAAQPGKDKTVLRPSFCLDVKTDEATRAEVRVRRCPGVLTWHGTSCSRQEASRRQRPPARESEQGPERVCGFQGAKGGLLACTVVGTQASLPAGPGSGEEGGEAAPTSCRRQRQRRSDSPAPPLSGDSRQGVELPPFLGIRVAACLCVWIWGFYVLRGEYAECGHRPCSVFMSASRERQAVLQRSGCPRPGRVIDLVLSDPLQHLAFLVTLSHPSERVGVSHCAFSLCFLFFFLKDFVYLFGRRR